MSDPFADNAHIRRPWEGLPPESFDALAPLLPSIAEEIIETLGAEVPAYAKPFEGEFGRVVRLGVEQSLEQFASLIRNPGSLRSSASRDVYVALGRGELRSGRSIGALLAAYRVGARVAWRRLSAAGLEAGLSQATLNRLAESIFAYIDELSAESAEGYALAQAQQAGETDRRREQLIDLLVSEDRTLDAAALTAASDAAGWRLPAELVVVVWRPEIGRQPVDRLPSGSIVADLGSSGRPRYTCAVVPDPRGPGRSAELEAALVEVACGVGSVVSNTQGAQSYGHAIAALQLGEARNTLGAVFADQQRAALLARADRSLASAAAAQRLQSFEDETAASQQRLRETLLEWLRHDGNVPEAAAALHVHAQTVRYRLIRLRELLGDQLDDPDARFELEVALRATNASA
ncbi:MAG: helix-turn-helix domain-containing protein [Thermoleophilaceae bacterium]|nr:helix-turn-helix domain-containing protein [Thermoleophilaceae bacterium]